MFRGIIIGIALIAAAGCSTLPTNVQRVESYATTSTDATALGSITATVEAQNPGRWGFHLLPDGLIALEARFAMADLAQKSIDVQTYQWGQDQTSGMLGLRLWAAAERGVRVRVLVDDFLLSNRDFSLAAFDAHPDIEVRVFNPFGSRVEPLPFLPLRRAFEFATDIRRLNHRMHNKSFIVDNEVAIIGGRNITDNYYGLSDERNFIDYDVLVAGTRVGEVSQGFDEFWNSDWAYPITAFRDNPTFEHATALVDAQREQLVHTQRRIGIPESLDVERETLARFVAELEWAHAEMVFDDPDKVHGRNPQGGVQVSTKLRELGARTDSELIILSPYLVAGPLEGTLVESLLAKGVRVRVLTNSLASTNQPPVHSGYKRYRKDLLRAGVELHETQVSLPHLVQEQRVPWSSGRATMHAKVLVFDREEVFVGTFNLDPRSIDLNTEMGIVVYDSELATQIAEFADTLLAEDASWRVELDDSGRLFWHGIENGTPVSHTREPYASVWRKLLVFIASLLPIEEQL